MGTFWRHVNTVIRNSDIILEVLDARMINETRNREIEEKVKKSGKILLYVVNKSDLCLKEEVEKTKKFLKPSVFVSSIDHLGTTILKKKILELCKGEKTTVGVLGYPNVGKSSLINALSGKGAAKTSSESGYTKGLQKVRVDRRILLLDTPGVFPNMEKDNLKHSKTGSISSEKVKNPDTVVLNLINDNPDKFKKFYQVDGEEGEEILENIGLKFNKLLKGNIVNIDSTSRMILRDWQKGKII
jgi:ribosome biogenesis GTPase A